jgi:hypothetical protein
VKSEGVSHVTLIFRAFALSRLSNFHMPCALHFALSSSRNTLSKNTSAANRHSNALLHLSQQADWHLASNHGGRGTKQARSRRRRPRKLLGRGERHASSKAHRVSASVEQSTRPTRADSYPSYDFNSTITVLVGKKEQQFIVHKDPICAKSKFFKAACSERWSGLRSSDGKPKDIKLPETSIRDFQTYVHWVYASQIEVEGDDLGRKHEHHLKMYILGDLLDDYQLRNAAMETLIDSLPFSTGQPSFQIVRHVYEHTPMGSPLRKLLVDRKIGRGNRADFAMDVDEYAVEFVQELAIALMKKVPTASRKTLTASVKASFERETGDV